MTITETLKHAVDAGERDAAEVVKDLRELLRAAEEATARGCKTLKLGLEADFSSWSSTSATVSAVSSSPAKITVSGSHDTTTAADPTPDAQPEPAPTVEPAPADPSA